MRPDARPIERLDRNHNAREPSHGPLTSPSALSPVALFDGIDPDGIVIVAVSGGSDSLALLLLAHAWAQTIDVTLHAVTVDHGLRPEAAAEAAFTAAVCEGLGIDHTTLGWEGLKPHSGLADAARRARYTILEEFAGAIGADIILAGHTADDQAETVWMRQLRGDTAVGARGLAGMARLTLLPAGTRLLRPLLHVSRAQLRDYLGQLSQSWIDDPSNTDAAYERVRTRQHLAANPQLKQQLIAFAAVMTDLRAVAARDTARLLAATVRMEAGPVFHLDLAVARNAPDTILAQAVQVLVAIAGGAEHFIAHGRALTMARPPDGQATKRATIGGAVIENSGAELRFYRERRNLESVMLGPGESVLWDGRYDITNNSADPVHAGPATREALREAEANAGHRLSVTPRAAMSSTLMVGTTNGALYFPFAQSTTDMDGVDVRLTARAIEYFCPHTDFPLLEWLGGLDAARNACLQPRS